METKEASLFRPAQVREKRVHIIETRHFLNSRYHYSVIERNPTVTEANKKLLVETFRSIAEILIWGDQNDSSVFE